MAAVVTPQVVISKEQFLDEKWMRMWLAERIKTLLGESERVSMLLEYVPTGERFGVGMMYETEQLFDEAIVGTLALGVVDSIVASLRRPDLAKAAATTLTYSVAVVNASDIFPKHWSAMITFYAGNKRD